MTILNAAYQWTCQPAAEQLLLGFLNGCCSASPFIEALQNDLQRHTSTRLFDWIDHFIIGNSPLIEDDIIKSGYIQQHATPTYRVFFHPGAQLPRIVLRDHDRPVAGIAIAVDSIADFLSVRGMTGWIEGTPFSQYRRCRVSHEQEISLWAIERRGTESIEPDYRDQGYFEKYWEAKEKWMLRPRNLRNEEEGFEAALQIAEDMAGLLGKDLAASVVLECERHYWQAKNTAGQLQKNRQDRLGMGWANHDHHTFRSSRRYFTHLVRLFEILGFHCRERFYAGEEAGWGAQVMENPRCRFVLFLDVDLAPHELELDFAHHKLPELDRLGTIGLWCALHGDSILKAGMHHLEAQFEFEELTRHLNHLNVRMMDPFSNFPYLKQAFTEGEVWHVDPNRIQMLVDSGAISHEQADKFRSYGAVGSHLENLQRREGYKGFNQKNVSMIIKRTDPRLL